MEAVISPTVQHFVERSSSGVLMKTLSTRARAATVGGEPGFGDVAGRLALAAGHIFRLMGAMLD